MPKPVTSYPRRDLAPATANTKPMPQHPLGSAADDSRAMADYHRGAADHFRSRDEHGIAAGHDALADKHEKRAARGATLHDAVDDEEVTMSSYTHVSQVRSGDGEWKNVGRHSSEAGARSAANSAANKTIRGEGRVIPITSPDAKSWRTDLEVTMSQELHPGDRVRIDSSGETGRVRSVDGQYLTVDEDSGYSTRLAAHGVTKMSTTLDERAPAPDDSVTMARTAQCPYCSKNVIMSRGALGDHRVPGGICDGARQKVARIELGRAVLA